MGMNYDPMIHDENANYHDHDSASRVPLMTDSVDKNSVTDPPIYTASASLSDPENGIPLSSVAIGNNLAVAEHRHCDTCLQQQERRERRKQQESCCGVVALVFIVLIVCIAAVGIVAVVLH